MVRCPWFRAVGGAEFTQTWRVVMALSARTRFRRFFGCRLEFFLNLNVTPELSTSLSLLPPTKAVSLTSGRTVKSNSSSTSTFCLSASSSSSSTSLLRNTFVAAKLFGFLQSFEHTDDVQLTHSLATDRTQSHLVLITFGRQSRGQLGDRQKLRSLDLALTITITQAGNVIASRLSPGWRFAQVTAHLHFNYDWSKTCPKKANQLTETLKHLSLQLKTAICISGT